MSLKDRTHEEIFKFRKGKPLNYFLKVARCMLTEKGTSPQIRGELGECVLLIMLEEFIKKNPSMCKDWILSQGLILADLAKGGKYLTELDVTLFTPKRVYLFECKSYKGEKVLTDKGFLNTKTSKGGLKPHLDVWDQHFKHFQALLRYISQFLVVPISQVKPCKIIFFDFSQGSLEDRREGKFKKMFPVVDENSLYSIFADYNELPVCWEMSYIRKVVKMLDEHKKTLTKSHRSYVTDLRRSRNSSR